MQPSARQPAEPEPGRLRDQDLLRRFVRDSDEAAFAEIVRRYRGLVMSVCYRVTGRYCDAEDAFQATFLILARRPRSVRHGAALSRWLYTVAFRTSRRLVRKRKRCAADSLSQEVPVSPPGPLERIETTQNLLILDEELHQLPVRYRDVLLMTCYGNLSSQQIADELNVSRGTVDGRIRRARAMLRVRLVRRGVTLSVLAAATEHAVEAASAASGELLQATIKMGNPAAAGSLTRLDPLVRPETAMLTSRVLMTGALSAAAAAAGIVGAYGLDRFGHSSMTSAAVPVILTSVADHGAADAGERRASLVLSPEAADAETDPAFDLQDAARKMAAYVERHRVSYYPDDASPGERWLYEQLDRPAPDLDFPGEASLEEILRFLSDCVTDTAGNGTFQMQIWPEVKILAEEGIDSLEDLTVRDISLTGVSLRDALTLIFERTYPDLTYVIRDNVMKITTVEVANASPYITTRVYPVGHLLGTDVTVPSSRTVSGGVPTAGGEFFSLAGPDSSDSNNEHEGVRPGRLPNRSSGGTRLRKGRNRHYLSDLVKEMTVSYGVQWIEDEGEGGRIAQFGNSLVVAQTPHGHDIIVRLLNQLTEAKARDRFLSRPARMD